MVFPAITAAYAAILALILMGLSIWVVLGRAKFKAIHGDGGHDGLQRRIRAHANFVEYVPFIVLLVALYEGGGGGRMTVHILLAVLVVARLLHPVGMVAPEGSVQQFACRAPGAAATWVILVVAAVLLLLR